MSIKHSMIVTVICLAGGASGYTSHAGPGLGLLRPFLQDALPPFHCFLEHQTVIIDDELHSSHFRCPRQLGCPAGSEGRCLVDPNPVPNKGQVAGIRCKCGDTFLTAVSCQMIGGLGDGEGAERAPNYRCSELGCPQQQSCALQSKRRILTGSDNTRAVIVEIFCTCR